MPDLQDYLGQAVNQGASDIFLITGAAPAAKINNEIVDLDNTRLMPKDTEALLSDLYQQAGRKMSLLMEQKDDAFSYAVPGLARFRVNTYIQRGSLAAVLRVVAFEIPRFEVIGIPSPIMDLVEIKSGLVIIAGEAGSGRSTTQACLIDRINHSRRANIITIEDPIEYLHRNDKSIISQREIPVDADSQLSALQTCLRQTPDVIQMGDLGDQETIRTAIAAAETGRLIIATMTANSVESAVSRIISTFPAEQQPQIQLQLSSVLRAVVAQQLLPSVDGGLVPAFELLLGSGVALSVIREGKLGQLQSIINTDRTGMWPMDRSIADLIKAGKVEKRLVMSSVRNAGWVEAALSTT